MGSSLKVVANSDVMQPPSPLESPLVTQTPPTGKPLSVAKGEGTPGGGIKGGRTGGNGEVGGGGEGGKDGGCEGGGREGGGREGGGREGSGREGGGKDGCFTSSGLAGGGDDGDSVAVDPPEHAQHIVLAVKSASSSIPHRDGAVV